LTAHQNKTKFISISETHSNKSIRYFWEDSNIKIAISIRNAEAWCGLAYNLQMNILPTEAQQILTSYKTDQAARNSMTTEQRDAVAAD
jgi:hypothetical protein